MKSKISGAKPPISYIIWIRQDSCAGCMGDGCKDVMIVRLIAIGRHVRMTDTINVGERKVQAQYRITLQSICKAHGIAVDDRIEVWIKKIKED